MEERDVVMVGKKYCPGCGETKNRTEFYRNSSKGDGLNPLCKPCALAKTKESQARVRERIGEDAWRARQREAQRRSRKRRGESGDSKQSRAYNMATQQLRTAHEEEFRTYYEEAKASLNAQGE